MPMDWYRSIVQKAVDEACSRGADMVHDPDRRLAWTPQDDQIWIRMSHDDRGRASLDRLRHWSEGYAPFRRSVDLLKPGGTERFRRMVEDEVSLVERLQRRDLEAETRCGTRYEPCPTGLSCHPVGLALALHAGLPRTDICSAAVERVGAGSRAVQDTHDAVSRARPAEGTGSRIRIRGETVLFREIEIGCLAYRDHTAEGPVLTVACDLPDTALAAIGTLTLRQVVDHPALDGLAPTSIRKAVRIRVDSRTAIALHLRRVSTPVAAKDTAA